MKCFHHTDLDGHCSAAIVKQKFPEMNCVEVDYDIEFPMGTVNDNELVFLVDFGFDDAEVLRELNDRADLYWIDHHASNIEKALEAGVKCKGMQIVDTYSGCELTWAFLNEGIPMPDAVYLLGRYDVWDHEADSRIIPFQLGMQARMTDPGKNMQLWTYLLENADSDMFGSCGSSIEEIVLEGEIIKKWVDQYNVLYAKGNAFTLEWEGYTWACVNNAYAGSDPVKDYFKTDQHDGMIVFGYKGRSKRWKVSFYTGGKSSLDCGEIAARYGGGGHKEAAGCTMEKLPFELPISNEDEPNR